MRPVLEDELDDPHGTKPYQESPGVWICRRCAAEIRHKDALCRHCKRARTIARRHHQLEEPDDE
jgi:predicted amidophosphoribosyltransferase